MVGENKMNLKFRDSKQIKTQVQMTHCAILRKLTEHLVESHICRSMVATWWLTEILSSYWLIPIELQSDDAIMHPTYTHTRRMMRKNRNLLSPFLCYTWRRWWRHVYRKRGQCEKCDCLKGMIATTSLSSTPHPTYL